MGIFKRFLTERRLKLCMEKTKVLVFNRKRKEGNEIWNWGKERIEEIKQFKYLGFKFNSEGDYTSHIEELVRKGRMAARKVWGLGERLCKKDYMRRWMLFKYLV